MADINFSSSLAAPDPPSRAGAPRRASADLRWDIIELLFFAYRDFVGDADNELEAFGFGRAHHRVMHFVYRYPGLKVADLLDVLRITKQSLGRVLKQLLDEGYIVQKTGNNDRRQRLLYRDAEGRGAGRQARQPADQAHQPRARGDRAGGCRDRAPLPARDDRPRRSRQGAGDDLPHRAATQRSDRDARRHRANARRHSRPTTRRISCWSTTTAASAICCRASSRPKAIASPPR